MFTALGPPTQAGYLIFLRAGVGIPASALPDNSPAIAISLAIACEITYPLLNCLAPNVYTAAVYNLAADRLINFAPDQQGQCYFGNIRRDLNLNSFVPGVIESSSDEATSQTFAIPDSLRHLQILDLQNLKTPYGRTYLGYAQMTGTLWGLN